MEWKESADAPPDQPGGAHLPTGTWVSVSGLSAIKAVVVPAQVGVNLASPAQSCIFTHQSQRRTTDAFAVVQSAWAARDPRL